GRRWKALLKSSERDDRRARRSPRGERRVFFGMTDMSLRLSYGVVRDTPRRVIHAVRVHDEILDTPEIVDLAERMRERRGAGGARRDAGRRRGDPGRRQGDAARVRRGLFGRPRARGAVQCRAELVAAAAGLA